MMMNGIEGALANHMQQLATNNNVFDIFINQSKAPKVRALFQLMSFSLSPLQPVIANSSCAESALALQQNF